MLAISFRLPFSRAIAAARRRGVLLPDDYAALPPEYRRYAFSVAGLAALEQIRQVQDSLARALQEGQSFADWKKVVPGSVGLLPPARLELIFRQHAQTAYMAGHHRSLMASVERRPFWMYSAVNDRRTRPAHAAMNGFIARFDDGVWTRWFPPCGFNCRCTIVSLTGDQASSRGYPMGRPPVEPDPGFAGIPTEGVLRIEQLVAREALRAGGPFTAAYERAIAARLNPAWMDAAEVGTARALYVAGANADARFAGLSPAEVFAINRWTDKNNGVYERIGKHMRGFEVGELSDMDLGIAQSLASAIRYLEAGGPRRVVYRGFEASEEILARYAREATPGTIAVSPSFIATSISREVAMNFGGGRPLILLEIETVRGANLGALSVAPEELEILLPALARFEVVSSSRIGDMLTIRLRDGRGSPSIALTA